MKLSKIGLLPRIFIAIILGVACGVFFPRVGCEVLRYLQ